MKTITLQEAYDIIKSSKAVIIDDDALCYPSLSELTGDPGNEWLYVGWDDGENEFYTRFIEEEQKISFDGQSIYMLDYEDSFVKITPLFPNKKYSDFVG